MVEILLMEDNPADVALFEIGLQESYPKCMLRVIDSREELITLLNQAANNNNLSEKIVILDLFTPTNDGLEILRQIRSDDSISSTSVLILTNAHEANVITKAYQLGVNAFLHKPGDYDEFLKMICGIIQFFGVQKNMSK